MASVYERITNALSSLGKRRERDSSSQDAGRGGAAGSAKREPKRFRPWEQSDLHRRLESYKPLTWFAKPESVGPVACALRGWVNDACDSLTCEHCGAKLVYPAKVPYDQRQAAADLFAPGLTSKHSSSCPWRGTQCEPSLLVYQPSASNDELCNLFQHLQNKLLRVDVLPDLDAIAIQAVRNAAKSYGSYEDIVLGSAGPGALTPRRTPRVRITSQSDDEGHSNGGEEHGASAAGGGSTGGAGPLADPSAAETFIIQPSKLTPQQKARLLALLGWDVEVLQPETASGSAAAPYASSTGYSLAHLGVKPKKTPGSSKTPPAAGADKPGSAAAAECAGGAVDDTGRYPMAQVVLKCPRCHHRMGLWNFAGVRPVPSGRLTPGQPSVGAASLLSPRVGSTGGAAGASSAAAVAAAAADPLSVTIAGGQYAVHGFGAAGAKPFGGAPVAPPFRFGSGSSSAPVFGISALDAQAPAQPAAATGGTAAGSGFGFGTPFGSPAPKLLTGTAATPTTQTAPATALTPLPPMPPGATTPAAGAASQQRGAPLTGHKRKASEPGSVSEPMALDMDTDTAGRRTPGVSFGGVAGAPDGKRQRVTSMTPSAGGAADPSPRVGSRTPLAEAQQLRELDPLNQHRSWCPWVYTGSGDQKHMSGWQHMLSALASQQLKQQEQPQVTPTGTATATPMDAQPGSVTPAAPVDARQLRDNALAAIRSL